MASHFCHIYYDISSLRLLSMIYIYNTLLKKKKIKSTFTYNLNPRMIIVKYIKLNMSFCLVMTVNFVTVLAAWNNSLQKGYMGVSKCCLLDCNFLLYLPLLPLPTPEPLPVFSLCMSRGWTSSHVSVRYSSTWWIQTSESLVLQFARFLQ